MTENSNDPYAWLEDIDGDEQLAWVRARNAEKAAALAETPGFLTRKQRLRTILDSDDKIAYVVRRGEYLYNFWRDANHERGLWRRTSMSSYATETPQWETVLDLDALNKAEDENWVWHGAVVWPGEAEPYRWALVHLSRGGADAAVIREFDLETLQFVEGGFELPEAKGGASWEDVNTLLVYTDFGEGSMTTSGYPRIVKRWHRGTPLEEAETLYEGELEDMYIAAGFDPTPGFERTLISRRTDFWNGELFLLEGSNLVRLDTPSSASEDLHREWLTVELRENWDTGADVFAAGSLLGIRLADFLTGSRTFEVLYHPTPSTSLAGYSWSRNHLVLTILDDVKNRVEILTPGEDGWHRKPASGLAAVGTVEVAPVSELDSDDVWLTTESFTTPTTLSLAHIRADATLSDPDPLKMMPAFFDASGLAAQQHFATSADGTRVPYFLVYRTDLPQDGSTPTLLYGYGGFEISLTPSYSPGLGAGWLEQGGAYVLANIRGGGEYGPQWHQAALKENRLRAYEDLAAVARDLIERGLTRPEHLGVQGGSNGGLLTGNMLVSYPDLFGAVVIQVPLLDMKRYSHLLAGASWVAEYGDPDVPAEWEFIRTFSPYHLVQEGQHYPPVLLMTSTRDDRVHPSHARKMAALLLDHGYDVTYFENIEGGHGGAANNEQAAHMSALAQTFLWERLS